MNRAESNLLRSRAHSIVWKAKKAGLLPKFDGSILCTDCEVCATEYDHRNYFKPLEVEPVCHSCNVKRGPAYPFTIESPNEPPFDGNRMLPKRDWKYNGLTQRLVEIHSAMFV